MKCKNFATCKGHAQENKKLCWECEKAEQDDTLYTGIGFVYLPTKHEGEHRGLARKHEKKGNR